MRGAVPWIITAACLLAFGASYLELQRVRQRFGEVTQRPYHDHQDVRQFVIKAALADASQPIVMIGDSITEMAPLPAEIAGHPVIDAGIGGISTSGYKLLAGRLFEGVQPYAVVIALGANDTGSSNLLADAKELIAIIKAFTPRVVVSTTATDQTTNSHIREAAEASGVRFIEAEVPEALKRKDHIHFTAAAYRVWLPQIRTAVEAVLANTKS
jgi:lysophospholipase L1-like esterase